MFDEVTTRAAVWIAVVVFLGLAITGAFWLVIARRLRTRFGEGLDKDAFSAEEGYRQTLAQVFGLPLAVIGVLGALITVRQGLHAYRDSVATDFQDRYKRGFDMLSSPAAGTRIGGLFILEGLLSQKAELEKKAGDDATSFHVQINAILQAVAAFGVEHSRIQRTDVDDPVVASDAQIALRVIGNSNAYVPDFPVDLSDGYFVGSFVPNANFEQVNLYRANFQGADLYNGQFHQANLRDSNFNGANLTSAKFEQTGFLTSTFCPARNLATAALISDVAVSVQMARTTFDEAFGSQVFFNGAYLEEATFKNSRFPQGKFVAADLEKASFLGNELDDADFTSATMKRVLFKPDIRSKVLRGVRFDNADFSSGQVENIDISWASFRNTNAKEAMFIDSTIDHTDFSHANLLGAHFKGTKITASTFTSAVIDETTFADATIDPLLLADAIHCTAAELADSHSPCGTAKAFSTSPPDRPAQHCPDNTAVRLRWPPLTAKQPSDRHD